MDRFAETREFSPVTGGLVMPSELQALQDNFDRMADNIMQDEAAMENTVREKNVLIKEVHHRVKNNLQLISSIMNMQIRQAKQDETKSALSRLQDRVLSLVRQASGGRNYDARFGVRQTGRGAYAGMLASRFRAASRKLGLEADAYQHTLDCGRFSKPGQQQMDLGF